MGFLVPVVTTSIKAIITSFFTQKMVEELIFQLLRYAVSKTDNTLDDAILESFEANRTMYKNFSEDELACNCNKCGRSECKEELVAKLQLLRDEVGFPIRLSSAFRCRDWNAKVGGHPRSSHMEGLAVDCLVDGERALKLIDAAIRLGFNGVGVSQKGKGQKFIHLDIKETPTKRIWSYA